MGRSDAGPECPAQRRERLFRGQHRHDGLLGRHRQHQRLSEHRQAAEDLHLPEPDRHPDLRQGGSECQKGRQAAGLRHLPVPGGGGPGGDQSGHRQAQPGNGQDRSGAVPEGAEPGGAGGRVREADGGAGEKEGRGGQEPGPRRPGQSGPHRRQHRRHQG